MRKSKTFRPDRIGSYFRMEWLSLALVTASGLIYNVGLLATPWFEGRLAQCLADILGGNETAAQMAVLVLVYIAVTLLCVAASVAASLLPPLLLGRVIDRLTAGLPLTFLAVLLYFGSLALEGVFSSAQESLLVLFGQKMTHALRSEMSRKLTRLPAGTLAGQNPVQVAARFSGDVDTVEALFTSGIISMVADACRIVSILAVIAVKNTGLALVLLLVLPLFAVFTRHVQKRMLAAQLDNRRAVAAVSGQVPETLHNIRTIRALGIESYRERRYDRCIGDSYAAMERTNFYDAVYSPVVLLLNAVVVGAVMLLSASGKAEILRLFGMSVGTSVAVISYISRIFAPIESLGMEIQSIQSAMAGVKRIDAFLAQPERTVPPEGEKVARGDVALSHVTFGYGEKPVLEDFSLTVKQGEQVTLVGRTGAGKKHGVQAAAGTVSAPKRHGDHRRRGRCGHSGWAAAHLYQLHGAAFFPRTGNSAGADHPERSADHRGNGAKRGEAGGDRRRHSGAAGGLRYGVYRRHVLPGRVAAAVHRPCRSGRSRRAAGRDHRQSGRGDRGAGAGRAAPGLQRAYRSLRLPPSL